jgi:hypothetical protein
VTDFIFYWSPWLLPATMLIVLTLSIELPYRFAKDLLARTDVKDDAWNVVQAALLTLASFMLGLSFAQAAGRFDWRRELVMREANAIRTTWLRADQLDAPAAREFRGLLTAYASDRLKVYQTSGDAEFYEASLLQSDREQMRLWSLASSAVRGHQTNQGTSLLMQALNDTINVAAEQVHSLTSHVPTVIVLLTLALVMLGALSMGGRFARDRSRPIVLSALYVIASVVAVGMVVDYDRPRTGFVTVSLRPLERQLQSMQGTPSSEDPGVDLP